MPLLVFIPTKLVACKNEGVSTLTLCCHRLICTLQNVYQHLDAIHYRSHSLHRPYRRTIKRHCQVTVGTAFASSHLETMPCLTGGGIDDRVPTVP